MRKRSKPARTCSGWDQSQLRSFEGICRHTALAALVQLRHAAIRAALHGEIALPPAPDDGESAPGAGPDAGRAGNDDADADGADLMIPLGDAPVPARAGQPCSRGIGLIGLSVAETARLARIVAQYAGGLITRAQLAFALRWSARRRRHQAAARWHHYSARLHAIAT